MLKIGIIIGSTRPGRNTKAVAQWVFDHAQTRSDAEFELVDIADYDLPLLDEPVPPAMGQYSKPHTLKWAAKIDSLDAFIFVVPEYNHSMSGAIKNAIDFLFKEWNNKAAGFVAFGSAYGTRAVEHLRGVMGELMVADVRNHIGFSLFYDFENYSDFKPQDRHKDLLDEMIDQVISWGTALQQVRLGAQTPAGARKQPKQQATESLQ